MSIIRLRLEKQYPNQWVVVYDEDVVAVGKNLADVVGRARGLGIRSPYAVRFYSDTPSLILAERV